MHSLLVDQTPFEIASGYLDSATDRPDFSYFVGAGCGLMLLWGAFSAFEYGRKWYRANAQTPDALLEDLCEVHDLDRNDRQVIAAAAGLAPAVIGAMVFLEPERLERLISEQPQWKDRAARVRRRLFGVA
jgi:hypothetical protein